jgi:hypothetical protein
MKQLNTFVESNTIVTFVIALVALLTLSTSLSALFSLCENRIEQNLPARS